MKITRVAVLAFAILALGCTSNEQSESAKEVTTQEQHAEETTGADDGAIELNDGQKWKVNEEMTPYILDGEKLLNEHDNAEYAQLAQELKAKNMQLINSCTMKGKSHDELHKWLHPHMDLIGQLENAENDSEASKVVAELKESFEVFHTYFQ